MHRRNQSGVTLPEVILMLVLMSGMFVLAGKGIKLIQGLMFEQMYLSQTIELATLNNEITTRIRSAKSIVSATESQLELEVYNFQDFPAPFDKRAILQPRKIVYRYTEVQGQGRVIKEDFPTLTSSSPISVKEYCRGVHLWPPTTTKPYFSVKYQSGATIKGVAITFRLFKPFFKSEWVPVPSEASVNGNGL